MEYLKEIERQRIANALEVIVDLCDDYNNSCLNCPLVVKSDYDGDDYCIFDCNNQAMRMKVEKLRGE